MEYEKVPLKERISYSFGDVSSNLLFVTVSTYIAYFYTDVFGLGAGIVGILLLMARVFDAVVDPFVGMAVDKTNTKWGKSRPYFLWFAIPFSLFGVALFFTPDIGLTGKIVYAFVTYMLFNIAFSFINLPLNSLLPSLTTNSQERTVLNSFRMVGGQVGSATVNLATLPLVAFLGQGSDQKGFLYALILIGVVALVLNLITFANTRERVRPKGNQSIPLKKSVKAINFPWVIMLITIFAYWVAYTVKTESTVYYFQYNLGLKNLVPLINGLTFFEILSMIFVPLFARHINKRNTMLMGYAIAVIGQLIVFFGSESVAILIIGNAVCFLGLGFVNGLLYAMVADTVDYGEWKSGIRAQGLLSASASFGFRFGAGIGGAIPVWIMSATGYVSNQEQNSIALFGIQFNYIWAPLIFFILGSIMLFFYHLDKHESKIVNDLAIKRNESQTLT